jgi:hypothetical protein
MKAHGICGRAYAEVQYDHRETQQAMLFRILADIVVFIHFLWIVFLIFGALPGGRYRTIKYIHIGGLGFALMLQALDWYCPLTYLEVWLRAKHDPGEAYAGSYIAHYLEKVIYIEVDRWIIAVLTIALCGMNIWLYGRGKKKHPSV